jgi:hypothetical protein
MLARARRPSGRLKQTSCALAASIHSDAVKMGLARSVGGARQFVRV